MPHGCCMKKRLSQCGVLLQARALEFQGSGLTSQGVTSAACLGASKKSCKHKNEQDTTRKRKKKKTTTEGAELDQSPLKPPRLGAEIHKACRCAENVGPLRDVLNPAPAQVVTKSHKPRSKAT